jgi:hypothetical protein
MSQENQLISYITTIFNIKGDSEFMIDEITEDLMSLRNADGFKEFIKKNVTNEENRHLSGYQKFLKILDDFKREKGNQDRDPIEKYCKKLIEKCRQACRFAWENKPAGKNEIDFIKEVSPHLKKEGKSLFNNKDVQLLNSIGGVNVWARDYGSDSFMTKLYFGVLRLKGANLKKIKQDKKNLMIGA